jgi:hypothetical protein
MNLRRFLFLVLLFLFCFAAGSRAEEPKKEIRQPAELTIHAFPKNLKYNFLGLFRNENMTPLLIGVDATEAVYTFDDRVRDYFRTHDTFHEEAKIASFIGNYYVVGGTIGGLFLVGNFSHNEHFHSMTYALAQGYIINNAWTNTIKFSIRRIRPDETNHRSFLSGHASNAFMVAAILNHYYGYKAGIPAYVVAAFVGASRVEKNRHFMSDVVAGATLGYVIGKTVAVHTTGTPQEQRTQWIPTFSPARKEAGLALLIHF